jgi:chromate transporter
MLSMIRELGRLGLFGFGGVGPQAYHYFVERCGWLTADEFAQRFSIAQALPGANVVNLCAIVGDEWFGPLGALAAVSAITVPPLVVVLIAASALAHVAHAPRLIAAECAVVAASAGLILATAYRIMTTIVRRRVVAAGLAVAVALAVGLHVVSMPLATICALAAGIAIDRMARVAA